MTYHIDSEARLVHIEGAGQLTDDDMIDCVKRLRADPDLEPDMPTLSDMRNIDMAFSPEGVREMVKTMHDRPADRAQARVAIVVSNQVAYGMGRMFELYTDTRVDPMLRVFQSMSEALDWLELPAGESGNSPSAP